ncbi:MAG: sel1 repeat family protein [Ruminococcus sp.]|nr:sel1 repeat family protein [Ruminococcus sp.]
MSESTQKLPVFVTAGAVGALSELDFSEHNFKTMDYTMELVKNPYYFFCEYGEGIKINAYNRTALSTGTTDGADGGYMTAPSFYGEVDGDNMSCLDDDETQRLVFNAANNLNLYLQQQGLEEKIAELDPFNCGIVVSAAGGELKAKVVTGVQRPNITHMSIVSLFQRSVDYGRPYGNEGGGAGLLAMADSLGLGGGFSMFDDDEDIDESNITVNDCSEITKILQKAQNLIDIDESEEAAEIYKKYSAEKFDIGRAQEMLCKLYYLGEGVEKDQEKAVYWAKKAAQNGCQEAEDIYDKLAEIDIILRKARAGDPEAMAKYSALLFNKATSDDDEEGIKESFEWAKKSAEQNCGEGLCTLGLCYMKGRGVDVDEAKACELFEKGAGQGHTASMTNLAFIYGNKGKEDDDEEMAKKAFELFKRAAELGSGVAMRNLAHCYQFEEGTVYDMEKAKEWYIKAAEFFPDDQELQARVQLYKLGF